MAQAVVTCIKHLLRRSTFICYACMWLSCNGTTGVSNIVDTVVKANTVVMPQSPQQPSYTNKCKVIHVMVALCDNAHQGIVPVPKGIGNGQDAATNLYWGCDYGVKAFFKNKTNWQLVATIKNPAAHILERCIFRQPAANAYMVADAYDGAYIKQTMDDFVHASAGAANATVVWQKDTLGILGNADIVAYIGHEGLMDFSLDSIPQRRDTRKREAIILACESKQYWANILHTTGAKPLLWTTQLMCPEAYTLDAALAGWLNKETDAQVHARASAAYSKYQSCSVKAASRLLATGF